MATLRRLETTAVLQDAASDAAAAIAVRMGQMAAATRDASGAMEGHAGAQAKAGAAAADTERRVTSGVRAFERLRDRAEPLNKVLRQIAQDKEALNRAFENGTIKDQSSGNLLSGVDAEKERDRLLAVLEQRRQDTLKKIGKASAEAIDATAAATGKLAVANDNGARSFGVISAAGTRFVAMLDEVDRRFAGQAGALDRHGDALSRNAIQAYEYATAVRAYARALKAVEDVATASVARPVQQVVNNWAGVTEAPNADERAARQADLDAWARDLDALEARWNPAMVKARRDTEAYEAAVADLTRARKLGVIEEEAYTAALAKLDADMNPATIAMRKAAEAQVSAAAAMDELRQKTDPAAAAQARYTAEVAKATAVMDAANANDAERAQILARLADAYDPSIKAQRDAAASLEATKRQLDPAYAAQARYATEVERVSKVLDAAKVDESERAAILKLVAQAHDPAVLAAKKEADALRALEDVLDRTGAASRRFAEHQALLDKALAGGTLDRTRHTELMKLLEEQRDVVNRGPFRGSANTRAFQALMPQVNDIVTTGLMGMNPLMILVQQGPQIMDVLSMAGKEAALAAGRFALMAAPVLAVAAAIALVISRAVTIQSDLRAFDVLLRATGQTAQFTAAQLREMAEATTRYGATREDANAVLDAAVSRRRFTTPDQLRDIGSLAVDMGVRFGGTVEAGKKLVEWLTTGIPGLRAMAKETEALSLAQYEAARAALAQGDSGKALSIMVDTLKGKFAGLHRESLSPAQQAFLDLKKAFDELVNAAANSKIVISIVVTGGEWMKGLAEFIQNPTPQAFAKWQESNPLFGGGLWGNPNANPNTNPTGAPPPPVAPRPSAATGHTGRPTAAGTAGGIGQRNQLTEQEQRDLSDLRDFNARLADAYQKVGAARQIALAGLNAEQAALNANKGAAAAILEGQEAEKRARIEMSGAIADQTAQMDIQSRGAVEAGNRWASTFQVVDGVMRSYAGASAEAVLADAEAKAAVDALTQGVDTLARKREIVTQQAAEQFSGSAKIVAGLANEVQAQQTVIDATKNGVAAKAEAQRQTQVARDTAQINALALAAEKVGATELAQKLRDLAASWDTVSKSKAAGDFKQAAGDYAEQLAHANEQLRVRESLVGSTDRDRAMVEAQQQATEWLYQQKKTYTDLNDEERKLYAQIVKRGQQNAELELDIQRQEDAWKTVTEGLEKGFDRATQSLIDGMVNGKLEMEDFGKISKGVFASILSDVVKLAALNPVRNALFGTNAGTLFDLIGRGSASSSGGAAGAAAIVVNGVTYKPQAGSAGAGGAAAGAATNAASSASPGFWTRIGMPGVGAWLDRPMFGYAPPAELPAGQYGPMPQQPNTVLGMQSPTWGQGIGSGIAGFGAGYGVGSVMKPGQKAISALTGAAMGALTGWAVGGPWGALIGGITGLAGALLGNPNKPAAREQGVTVNFVTGSRAAGGQGGDKFSTENANAASKAADFLAKLAKTMEGASVGGKIAGDGWIGFADTNIRVQRGSEGKQFERSDAGLAAAMKWFAERFAADLGGTLDPALAQVIRNSTATSVDELAKMLAFASDFDDVLKQFSATVDITAEAFMRGKSSGDEFAKAITDLIEQTANTFRAAEVPGIGYALPAYATGTLSSAAGPALVGELGREIVQTPDGRRAVVGASGPEIVNLPGGSRVWNARESAAMLAGMGEGADTELVHVRPDELAWMRRTLGGGRINPRTGLPMFLEGETGGVGDTSPGSSSPGSSSPGNSNGPGNENAAHGTYGRTTDARDAAYGGGWGRDSSSPGGGWLDGLFQGLKEVMIEGFGKIGLQQPEHWAELPGIIGVLGTAAVGVGYGAAYGIGAAVAGLTGQEMSVDNNHSNDTSGSGSGDVDNPAVKEATAKLADILKSIGDTKDVENIGDVLKHTTVGKDWYSGTVADVATIANGNEWARIADGLFTGTQEQFRSVWDEINAGMKTLTDAGLPVPKVLSDAAAGMQRMAEIRVSNGIDAAPIQSSEQEQAAAAARTSLRDSLSERGVSESLYGQISALAATAGKGEKIDPEGLDFGGLLAQIPKVREALAASGNVVPESLTSLEKQLQALKTAREAFDAKVAGTVPELSDIETAVQETKGFWSEMADAARTVGYTAAQATAKAQEGLSNAITKMRGDYEEALADETIQATDRSYLTKLRTADESREKIEKNLLALGYDATRASTTAAQHVDTQVKDFLEGLNVDQLHDVIGNFTGSIRDAATSIRTTSMNKLRSETIATVEQAIDSSWRPSVGTLFDLNKIAADSPFRSSFTEISASASTGSLSADTLRVTTAALLNAVQAGTLKTDQLNVLVAYMTDAYSQSQQRATQNRDLDRQTTAASASAGRITQPFADAFAIALDREAELASTTDATTRVRLQAIYALQDEARALDAARKLRAFNADLLGRRQTLLGNSGAAALTSFDLQAAQQVENAVANGQDVAALRATLAAERAKQVFDSARADYLERIDREITAREESTESLREHALRVSEISKSFRDAAANLRLSENGEKSPKERLDEIRKQFEDAVSGYRAAGNDFDKREEWAQKLQSLGQQRVDIAAGYFQTTDYSDYRRVLSIFDEFGVATDAAASTAEETIKQNDRIIKELQEQRKAAERMDERQLGSLESLQAVMQGAKATLDAQLAQLAATPVPQVNVLVNGTAVTTTTGGVSGVLSPEQRYLIANPDVAANAYYSQNVAEHYAINGAREGRDRMGLTLTQDQQYLARYADVAAAVARGEYATGREHFDAYGRAEGRQYATGGLVTGGPAGIDTVPVWLTNGERVLSVPHSRMMEAIYGMAVSASISSRAASVMPANDPMPPMVVEFRRPDPVPQPGGEEATVLREMVALLQRMLVEAERSRTEGQDQRDAIAAMLEAKLEELAQLQDEVRFEVAKLKKAGG